MHNPRRRQAGRRRQVPSSPSSARAMLRRNSSPFSRGRRRPLISASRGSHCSGPAP